MYSLYVASSYSLLFIKCVFQEEDNDSRYVIDPENLDAKRVIVECKLDAEITPELAAAITVCPFFYFVFFLKFCVYSKYGMIPGFKRRTHSARAISSPIQPHISWIRSKSSPRMIICPMNRIFFVLVCVPRESSRRRLKLKTMSLRCLMWEDSVMRGMWISIFFFYIFFCRKKWIHCFENVTSVIFVAAISEYDQVCVFVFCLIFIKIMC